MKRERRMNWFDWMLVGLVALLLGGVFFGVRYAADRADGTAGRVTYIVLISDAEEMELAVGATLRSQNGTAVLGEVVEIQVQPHRYAAVRDGEIVIAQSPDRLDYTLTVRAEGREKEGDGVRVGDIRLAAGMRVSLRVDARLVDLAEISYLEWEAENA